MREQKQRATETQDKRNLVCFERSFRYEGADNITHATLDGERTLCGRKDWVTSEGWDDIGPDCLHCARALAKITAESDQNDTETGEPTFIPGDPATGRRWQWIIKDEERLEPDED